MLARIDAVPLDSLPDDKWLLAKLLRHTFESGSSAEAGYWLDSAVTPYMAGFRINGAHAILTKLVLKSQEDFDNYLRLVDSYATMLEQIAAKTRAQAQRGIRVARPAIPGVVATFRGMLAAAPGILVPADDRLKELRGGALKKAVQERVNARVVPNYKAIIGMFDDAYTRAAPAQVGIGNLPGGKERYLQLIGIDSGLKLTPQEINDLGKKRVAEIDERMQAIRTQLGFKGSREAFQEKLRRDPRFIAKTPQDVEKRYLSYVARMEPMIPKYFSRLPKAPYGVRRLALSAEKGMTYGYYNHPTPAEPKGYYNYNGSDLDKRSLATAEHLIFHELIPGHHFHIALQMENPDAHPVRKFLTYSAFTEGWAEYAASLGEEMGLYDDPYDLYGHLAMQSFLAVRLVVDTGMNYFGMPLEEARAFMKAHTFESDVQINSETLRYSTDMPAQALNYRLGYEKIWELRHRAEKELGAKFDIKAFHAATLGEGAMPLNVLEEVVDRYIKKNK